MYDIGFYYKKNFPQYKLDWLKKTYPTAHFIQVGETFNYLIYTKRLLKKINTSMFWFLPAEIGISNNIFKFTVPEWDVNYVHHQLIGYDNLFLIPKNHVFTDDQFEKNFFNEVKLDVDFGLFYKKIYDVFFLSYKEKTAEKNYQELLKKYPYARRVKDVKGIFNAHLQAALDSSTDFFWVVDADAEIMEDFNFDYEVPSWDFDVVHIWPSKNKVNNLVYGNGGVKLLPRHLILDADPNSVDVTTSLGANIKIMEKVSNYNNFATGPFSAWRAAFRECAKLASAVIDRQVQEETDHRLVTWLTIGKDTKYGEYIISGANAGKEFGEKYKGNPAKLKLINNWDWLKEQFTQQSLKSSGISQQ
jgi:hypothetical protein